MYIQLYLHRVFLESCRRNGSKESSPWRMEADGEEARWILRFAFFLIRYHSCFLNSVLLMYQLLRMMIN